MERELFLERISALGNVKRAKELLAAAQKIDFDLKTSHPSKFFATGNNLLSDDFKTVTGSFKNAVVAFVVPTAEKMVESAFNRILDIKTALSTEQPDEIQTRIAQGLALTQLNIVKRELIEPVERTLNLICSWTEGKDWETTAFFDGHEGFKLGNDFLAVKNQWSETCLPLASQIIY